MNPLLRTSAKKGNLELVSKGHPVMIRRMFPHDSAGGKNFLVQRLCLQFDADLNHIALMQKKSNFKLASHGKKMLIKITRLFFYLQSFDLNINKQLLPTG